MFGPGRALWQSCSTAKTRAAPKGSARKYNSKLMALFAYPTGMKECVRFEAHRVIRGWKLRVRHLAGHARIGVCFIIAVPCRRMHHPALKHQRTLGLAILYPPRAVCSHGSMTQAFSFIGRLREHSSTPINCCVYYFCKHGIYFNNLRL